MSMKFFLSYSPTNLQKMCPFSAEKMQFSHFLKFHEIINFMTILEEVSSAFELSKMFPLHFTSLLRVFAMAAAAAVSAAVGAVGAAAGAAGAAGALAAMHLAIAVRSEEIQNSTSQIGDSI